MRTGGTTEMGEVDPRWATGRMGEENRAGGAWGATRDNCRGMDQACRAAGENHGLLAGGAAAAGEDRPRPGTAECPIRLHVGVWCLIHLTSPPSVSVN